MTKQHILLGEGPAAHLVAQYVTACHKMRRMAALNGTVILTQAHNSGRVQLFKKVESTMEMYCTRLCARVRVL